MNKNSFNTIIIALFLFASGVSCTTETPKSNQPNVIVIYTDDQGAIDLNSYGAADLVTPNMDKIVTSGVKFTEFYGAPVCSPSRAGLLTGKTPQRAGVPGNVSATNPRSGMLGSQYTMAEMFKDAGYKTGHIGKWHLGHSEEKQPNAQGFDYSFGHLVGCIDNFSHFFYWNGPNRHDLFLNGEEIHRPGQFFPDMMVEEASAFMDKNKENPFFIYFAMNIPHYPYQGSPEWLKYYQDKGLEYPRDLYAAFLSTQDDKIGELLQKVEDLGLSENTIIVFQSDNGYSTEERAHFGGGNAGLFRGSKSCLFEGGIRVPAAISWPAKIKGNQVREQFSVNADWMPTLAEFCGIDLDTKDLDGKSLVPVIMNKDSQSVHKTTFCWQHGKQWAARKGDWKLLGNPSIRYETFDAKDSLFLVNLKEDIGETTNLAAKYPEKVKELQEQFKVWKERN
jgi:arylsulfatase A